MLTFEEADNRATFDIGAIKPRYGIGGVDLSATTDLTAACVIFKKPGDETLFVESMFWLPSDLLEKRVKEDQIKYDVWHERGLLRTSDGNKIDYRDVVAWFREMQEVHDIYIPWVGYDSWSASYFVQDMASYFGKEAMEPVIQGPRTQSEPMQSLVADIKAKRVNYNNNPCLKWNFTNVSALIDRNNNWALVKAGSAKKRIDGFAALLDAYVTYGRHKEDYESMI